MPGNEERPSQRTPRARLRRAPALIAAAIVLAASSSHAAPEGGRYEGRRSSPLASVEEALAEERYEAALRLLAPLRESRPRDADVWNLTGFASRKLGRIEEARAAYARALELEPKHRRAHEYLGELHLQTGDLAAAEKQLAILDEICWLPCREGKMLREAIEAYRKREADSPVRSPDTLE